uniref:Uncharacterized protein n=1 Tax=Pseudomonas phage HRDY3 TaxID=3236930 RepID=A0AB39CEU0_9VIRU
MRAVFMKHLNTQTQRPEVVALASTDNAKYSTAQLLEHAAMILRGKIERGELKEEHIYEVNLRN